MHIDGAPYAPAGAARRAREAGVALIHQELSLCDHLTVAENVLLGREPRRGGRSIAPRRDAEAARVLERVPPSGAASRSRRRRPADCRRGRSSRSAARVSAQARVVLMDEPTSSLPREDVERLFALIRRLRARRRRHRLHQPLPRGSARRSPIDLTVLRDGRSVGTGTARPTLTNEQLIATWSAAPSTSCSRARQQRPPDDVRLDAARRVGAPPACGEASSARARAARSSASPASSASGRTELLRGADGPRAPAGQRAPVGRRRGRAARDAARRGHGSRQGSAT